MKQKPFTFSKILFTYFLIAFILIVTFFLISGVSSYYKLLKQIEDKLIADTSKITNSLNSTFLSIEKMELFLGNNILNNANNLKYIYMLFQDFASTQNSVDNLLSWIMYNWFDANDFNRVTAKTGIIHNNITKMSFRDYVQQAHKRPWKLIIDGPLIGIPSGQEVIVGGMGVNNQKGKFLGSINMGIPVANLTKFLDSQLSLPAFSYLLINDKGTIISSNMLYKPTKMDNLLIFNQSINHIARLPKPITLYNNQYIYLSKLKDYPLYLMTGYNISYIKLMKQNLIIAKLYLSGLLLILTLIFFVIFKVIFIRPIEKLTYFSQHMFENEYRLNTSIISSYEVASLYKALLKLKLLFRRNQRKQITLINTNSNLQTQTSSLELAYTRSNKIKQKLESAIKIIKTSDEAKQLFLRQITQDLKAPVVNIIEQIKKLESLIIHSPFYKDLKHHLDNISLSSLEINNYTRFTFSESSINLKSLIEEALLILQKNIYINNLKVVTKMPELLPIIKADKFRLKQAIIALLYRAIQQTPVNNSICINCTVEQKPNCILLEIIDSGFGLEPDEIDRIRNKLDLVQGWDGIELAMNMIKLIIQNHGGTLQVHPHHGKGTTYLLYLPY